MDEIMMVFSVTVRVHSRSIIYISPVYINRKLWINLSRILFKGSMVGDYSRKKVKEREINSME
jgi:hypothetical protein